MCVQCKGQSEVVNCVFRVTSETVVVVCTVQS